MLGAESAECLDRSVSVSGKVDDEFPDYFYFGVCLVVLFVCFLSSYGYIVIGVFLVFLFVLSSYIEVTFSKTPPRSHEETVTSLSLLYMGTCTKGQRAQPSCERSRENSEISVKDLFLPAILTFFFVDIKA